MLISERGYERLKSPFKALFVSMKRDCAMQTFIRRVRSGH